MFPDSSELLRRTRALIPLVAAEAAAGARDRRLGTAVIAALQDAGVFRVLQPRRWGGYELSPLALYELEMAAGEGDMSAAWVIGVFGNYPLGRCPIR